MKAAKVLLVVLMFCLLLGGLVSAISVVQNRMNNIRQVEELTATAPLENAPPIVAFTTIALGGFRGLLADWLWLRLHRMQEQGSYFEMVQLASWILKLQPRFTAATAFLSWNMAYNVSVTFASFEERWRWVQRGIELIRDEGLVYNPGDPVLFQQLGWIYQHKMGQYMDDANRYYKIELARQMIKALGEYPPDWRALAEAPVEEKELYAALDDGEAFQKWLASHNLAFAALEDRFRQEGSFPAELAQEAAEADWLPVVEACLRNRWLQKKLKLEPRRIADLNDKYGQLDWRLPEAHSIYWATRGLEVVEGDARVGSDKNMDFKVLTCKRMVYQSLFNAFRGGRLIYLKDVDHLEWTANLELADAADSIYQQTMSEHDNLSIPAAYGNFLVDAVVFFYQFGRRKKAQEYLDRARSQFPQEKRFKRSLDEFALDELAEDLVFPGPDYAQTAVQSYILHCCNSLAIGEYDRAVTFEKVASHVWRKYMRKIGKDTYTRRQLPPYSMMKRNAVQEYLKRASPSLAERLRAELGQPDLKVDLPVDKSTVEPRAKLPGPPAPATP